MLHSHIKRNAKFQRAKRRISISWHLHTVNAKWINKTWWSQHICCIVVVVSCYAHCAKDATQVIISIALAAVNFPKRWYSSHHHHRQDNISHQHSSSSLSSSLHSAVWFGSDHQIDRLSIDWALINMLYINLQFEIRPSAKCKTSCDSDHSCFIVQMPRQLMEIDDNREKTHCVRKGSKAWSKVK